MTLNDVVIHVGERPITVADVLVHLKVNGVFRDAVCQLVELEVLRGQSRDLGISITEEDVEEFCQTKRHYWGLTQDDALDEYCRRNGITFQQWFDAARGELLRNRVREAVVSDRAVLEYFNQHKADLRTITLSRIVSAQEEDAHRLRNLIESDGKTFSELARVHSIEPSTRVAGGYLGAVRRGMLPPALDERLFAAEADELVGPIEQDGYFALYHIDAIADVDLNETLRRDISDRLFNTWLQNAYAATSFGKQHQ